MRFTTALVACFAAYVSAMDLEAKAEAVIDLDTKAEAALDVEAKAEAAVDAKTKTEAKEGFTPVMMEELGAPIVNGTGSITPSAADASGSTDTSASSSTDTSASTENADTSASNESTVTADTVIPTLTVNEQEESPGVESANYPGPRPKNAKVPYDEYFANPYHQQHDYLRPGPDKLPSKDFNKQVYEYNEMKQIWHQSNYDERVKVEAEVLVTLEALKTSTRYMGEDLTDIKKFLSKQYLGVRSSTQDKDMDLVHGEVLRVNNYAGMALSKCK